MEANLKHNAAIKAKVIMVGKRFFNGFSSRSDRVMFSHSLHEAKLFIEWDERLTEPIIIKLKKRRYNPVQRIVGLQIEQHFKKAQLFDEIDQAVAQFYPENDAELSDIGEVVATKLDCMV